MLLSQILNNDGSIAVVVREGSEAAIVRHAKGTYELVLEATIAGKSLADVVAMHGLGEAVDLYDIAQQGRLTLPISHPDPTHMHLTGTGLTHLGSASARDAMHAKLGVSESLTDSMKMFRMGLEGGRPAAHQIGAQPEWFYKGNGHTAVAPGKALTSPGFALDGGEEPELAGIYLIAPDGSPMRVGWALANEFSDHVTEKINYLYLAHSKLREASFGPEILVGELPADVQGTSRIIRHGEVIFEKAFLSGEVNMSHTFSNLEHHHFKYALFRQPGDLHVHMFGTATLSFAEGIATQAGDVFEIAVDAFGLPLRNTLAVAPPLSRAVTVKQL
jgi:hypothetical protein